MAVLPIPSSPLLALNPAAPFTPTPAQGPLIAYRRPYLPPRHAGGNTLISQVDIPASPPASAPLIHPTPLQQRQRKSDDVRQRKLPASARPGCRHHRSLAHRPHRAILARQWPGLLRDHPLQLRGHRPEPVSCRRRQGVNGWARLPASGWPAQRNYHAQVRLNFGMCRAPCRVTRALCQRLFQRPHGPSMSRECTLRRGSS